MPGVERVAIMEVKPKAPFLESKYVPMKPLNLTGGVHAGMNCHTCFLNLKPQRLDVSNCNLHFVYYRSEW